MPEKTNLPVAVRLTCSLLWPPSSWTPTDGTASGFNVRRTLPFASKRLEIKFSKQSSAKWLQHTLKSLQEDSLNCCSLALAKNWTQSNLLSGSLGNLNRCARLVHPATEHISRRIAESVTSTYYSLNAMHIPNGKQAHLYCVFMANVAHLARLCCAQETLPLSEPQCFFPGRRKLKLCPALSAFDWLSSLLLPIGTGGTTVFPVVWKLSFCTKHCGFIFVLFFRVFDFKITFQIGTTFHRQNSRVKRN